MKKEYMITAKALFKRNRRHQFDYIVDEFDKGSTSKVKVRDLGRCELTFDHPEWDDEGMT